jgi:hypothetical protein
MRYLRDIPHPTLKIGVYAWNQKHIVKIEAGPFEQTYKIADTDLTDPDADITALLDADFLARVDARFHEMAADWYELMERG